MPDIDVTIVRHEDRPAWPELNQLRDDILVADPSWKLAAVEGGMHSGAHSIALRLVADGQIVIAEMSLALWIAATCAVRGAFPDAFAATPLASDG